MNSKIAFLLLGLPVAISGVFWVEAQAQEAGDPAVAPSKTLVWKVRPKVGQRFDFRLFLHMDSRSEKSTDKTKSGRAQETGGVRSAAQDWVVYSTTAHFNMDVLSVTPVEWKAKFTFLDSSFSVVRDASFSTGSSQGLGKSTEVEKQRAERRRKALLAYSSRFSRLLKGAQITAVLTSSGKVLRMEGEAAWTTRVEEASLYYPNSMISVDDVTSYVHPGLQDFSSFKQELSYWLEGIPEKPLAVGDKWTYKSALLAWALPNLKPLRKLLRMADNIAIVSDELSLNDTVPQKIAGGSLFRFVGRRKSTLNVDVQSGLPLRSQQVLSFKIETGTKRPDGTVQYLGEGKSTSQTIVVCAPLSALGKAGR